MRPLRAAVLTCAVAALAWCVVFPEPVSTGRPATAPAGRGSARGIHRPAPEPLRKLVQQALALPDTERSKALDKAMAQFARRVSAEDAAWMLELKKRGGEAGISDEQWQQFIERWAGAEPEKTATFLEEHGLVAGAEVLSLFTAWSHGDAPSILAWVAAGDDKRKAWWGENYLSYGWTWAKHDLDGALAWLENQTGGDLDSPILASLKQQRGIAGVEAWLSAHGEKASASARVNASTTMLQHTHKIGGPEAAAAYLESRAYPDELAKGVHMMSTSFTAAAPEKALTWLDRLASRPGFPRSAAEAAMAQWVATDSGAAGDWLNAHRNSPAFKEYVWAYAMNLAVENPDAARQWAALLPAEASPTVQTVNGIAWQKVDPFAGGFPGQSFGTLAQHIDAAAGLLSARNQPATASPPVVAQSGFRPRYNAYLVRESPGAEPTVRMVPRSGYG